MPDAHIGEATLFSSLRELGSGLRERRLSSVALTQAYLHRLETLGPKLGAVVTITRELALEEARAADRELAAGHDRGPLHGIPYGLKDLIATRGIPTTWGAEVYRKQVFNYDATVVRKLRAAGAVLTCKLAMVELAGGFGYNRADASLTGAGLNPWNVKFWAGGSSSGPGSAVGAGLVPFAIGSETSGSIITPAAFSGISGLRPTYGRVSRYGAMALSWTMDKLGPMCRTADDCGLVLAAIAGRDPLDASTAAKVFTYPEARTKQKFRVGIIRGSYRRVQPAVRRNFERSLKVLDKFCEIEPDIALPDQPFGTVVSTVIHAEGASSFRDLLETGRASQLRNGKNGWGGYAGETILAVDYLQAMRVRTAMKKTLDDLYSRFDALVAPSRPTVAYPADLDFDEAYPGISGGPAIIPAGNIAGQPAISIPNGFGANGLPTGIQFTGRVWSEARLLTIAHLYQGATDWHKRRPKLEIQ